MTRKRLEIIISEGDQEEGFALTIKVDSKVLDTEQFDLLADAINLVDTFFDTLDWNQLGKESEPETAYESPDSKHRLAGNWQTRQVWLDGKELPPGPSQRIWNHSPDGFNWGYGGSGPAQLALAICLKLLGKDEAQRIYQSFKFGLIARLPHSDFDIEFSIADALKAEGVGI